MNFGIEVTMTFVSLILSLFCAGTSYLARLHMYGQTAEMRVKNAQWSVAMAILSFAFASAFLAFGVSNWQELKIFFMQ